MQKLSRLWNVGWVGWGCRYSRPLPGLCLSVLPDSGKDACWTPNPLFKATHLGSLGTRVLRIHWIAACSPPSRSSRSRAAGFLTALARCPWASQHRTESSSDQKPTQTRNRLQGVGGGRRDSQDPERLNTSLGFTDKSAYWEAVRT